MPTERASLAMGSVSSHQHTASTGNHGCRRDGRKGCASTCGRTRRMSDCHMSGLQGPSGFRAPKWVGSWTLWLSESWGAAHPPPNPPHWSSYGQPDCGPASHWPSIIKGANRTKSFRVLISWSHCAWPEAHTWGHTGVNRVFPSTPPLGAAGCLQCMPPSGWKGQC